MPNTFIRLTAQDEQLITKALSTPKYQLALDFFFLGIQTGMRRHELTSLTWKQVDLAAREIHLSTPGAPRTIPMSSAVNEVLQRRSHTESAENSFVFGPAPHNQVGMALRIWHKISKQLGIVIFGLRELRYTYAERLVMAGFSLTTVCDLLGWSRRNLHISPAAVASLPTSWDIDKAFQPTTESEDVKK